jgi:hypothetical protein
MDEPDVLCKSSPKPVHRREVQDPAIFGCLAREEELWEASRGMTFPPQRHLWSRPHPPTIRPQLLEPHGEAHSGVPIPVNTGSPRLEVDLEPERDTSGLLARFKIRGFNGRIVSF